MLEWHNLGRARAERQNGPHRDRGRGERPVGPRQRRPDRIPRRRARRSLTERPDYGTMGLALLGRQEGDAAAAALPNAERPPGLFAEHAASDHDGNGAARRPAARQPAADAGNWRPARRRPSTFVVTWHFPNLSLPGFAKPVGRWYATRFANAAAVANYVADNIDRLAKQTRLWRDTWYDSTLPYWLLDRLFINTSILATSTCHRFADGRFYGWEGVGCCVGTCTHVWHYAHARGPAFPGFRAIRPRDAGLRPWLGSLRLGPLPRRNGRRHIRHRRPSRHRPALLSRTSDVAGRRFSQAQLAEDQEGDGIPDESRREA